MTFSDVFYAYLQGEVEYEVQSLSVLIAAPLFTAISSYASFVGGPGTPCIDVTGKDAPCSGEPIPGLQQAEDPTFVLFDPSVTNLGIFVVPGDVVLFETPNGNLQDKSTWSDVVHFGDVAGVTGSTATVYPDVDPGILLPPGFALSANALGIRENPVGTGTDADTTTYIAGSAVYLIHSDSPCCEVNDPETPEPATVGLFGLGLVGIFALRRRFR